MSIFSRVRKSRQQAKEHNAKLVEQQKKEEVKPPYRHVPTHAAADAIASAPPSWRDADRARIVEQNRRRSAMAASGHHMNMPGAPRVGSSLSHVSYPTDINANPRVAMSRPSSYTGMSPYSANHGREAMYTVPDMPIQQFATMPKGKGVSTASSYESPRISPTSSKGESSSSSDSTSSQDDLEMRPARTPARPLPAEVAHRLHPNHRRTSDSSIERIAMANSAKGAGLANPMRDPRPPPSTRGFGSIAPIANAPVSILKNSSTGSGMGSRQNSNGSLSSHVGTPTSPPTLAPTVPASTVPAAQPENIVSGVLLPSHDVDTVVSVGQVRTAAAGRPKDRKVPKTTRFSELERIESNVETPAPAASYTTQSVAPHPTAHNAQEQFVINVFPEEDSVPEPEPRKSGKSKRFSKSGGRLIKKDRWASSKIPVVTV